MSVRRLAVLMSWRLVRKAQELKCRTNGRRRDSTEQWPPPSWPPPSLPPVLLDGLLSFHIIFMSRIRFLAEGRGSRLSFSIITIIFALLSFLALFPVAVHSWSGSFAFLRNTCTSRDTSNTVRRRRSSRMMLAASMGAVPDDGIRGPGRAGENFKGQEDTTTSSSSAADTARHAAKRARTLPLPMPLSMPTISPSATAPAAVPVTDDDTDTTSSDVSDISDGHGLGPQLRRPPLRFSFKGWSIWLDLEEPPPPAPVPSASSSSPLAPTTTGPFSRALSYAAQVHNVHPIPAPHITVLYGIDHHDEATVLDRFRSLEQTLGLQSLDVDRKEGGSGWPALTSRGVLVDTEIDGVNGGTMTMRWAEISLASTAEQERLIDLVWDCMYGDGGGDSSDDESDDASDDADDDTSAGRADDSLPASSLAQPPPCRAGPWAPHLSLCYDNPEDTPLELEGALDVVAKFPCLLGQNGTSIVGGGSNDNGSDFDDGSGVAGIGGMILPTGLSLWSTEGTMDQWYCVDRISFR